jgi:hypothetical protein
MKKKWKWILGGLVVAFGLLQLTNPARTNPPVVHDVMATNPPPAQVAAVLQAACYDCHSHETKWPWYSHVAPVSWLVVSDVNEGRQHVDFSDWPTDPEAVAKKLDRINEVMDYREMPPKQYTLMHAKARLTDADRKLLMDWSDTEAAKLRATNPKQ